MPSASAQNTGPRDVAVIGAGIVGVSAALYLQRDGHRVTVIDPRPPGRGASFGNAGAIVTGSCAPEAMPGILKQVPGMMLDPLGPVTIRWRHLPRLAPWLVRFVAASRPARVEAISQALAALVTRAGAPWRDLTRQASAEDWLRPVGWLKVYDTDAGFAATRAQRDLFDRRGIAHEVLTGDALRQLEPALAPIFKHGWFQPGADYVTNPGRVVQRMAAAFVAAGGRIEQAAVTGLDMAARPRRILTDGGGETADIVVLAAGAWSRGLARQLGAKVPLDTERGYHLMLPHPEPNLRRPTVWGEKSFVLGPMEEGLRLNSQVEFAGLAAPPDYRRIRSLLPLARTMLPSLEPEEQSVWLGCRPSMPDSLPVIGWSPRDRDAVLAFGHGHLGLTLGPLTGRLVADMVAGRDPGFDLAPYGTERWA